MKWRKPFLAALAESPNVAAACRTAKVSRETAYLHKRTDPEFAAAWQSALDISTDDLVGEMYRRAVHGVERPVYQQGKLCGTERHYSDALAIFLAKTHRPGVYGDRLKLDAKIIQPDAESVRSELATVIAALRGRRRDDGDPPGPGVQLAGGSGGGGDGGEAIDPSTSSGS
jgi:hypothetical protein